MKKLIVIIALLVCQPSFANDWFPQIPSTEEPAPNEEIMPKTLPPGQNQSLGVFLKAPCGAVTDMTNTIKKYREEMLFHGTGLTFSPQNQVYNGGMFFFTNQKTGSWTILQVFPDGMACMIMNGKNFQPYTGAQPYGVQQ
jgi:hypothetical protein